MEIGILGPLEVRSDGYDDVPVAGSRLRRLLTRLALDAGRVVSMAELVDAVWLDDPPREVANALQSLVSRLRRAVGNADSIQQARAGYRLTVPADAIDAHRFAEQVAAGRRALESGDARSAREQLSVALGLWRGEPLADADGALYAAAPTARWNEVRLSALAARISADLALGRAGDVVGELQEITASYPLREQFVEQLMTALAAVGRTGDALAAYEALRERLADETGADPGAAIQERHLALLRGEANGGPAGGDGAPAGADGGAGASPDQPDRPRTNLRAALSSFIGREAELQRVETLVVDNRLTTIVGPGGAGKTRLATEAARPLVDTYDDGVWLVELASVTEPSAVASAVLGAFGYRDARVLQRSHELATAQSATDRVLDTLAESDALLVIDNCEHLIGAVAEFTELLLARCARLRVLATSREPLAVPGEALVSVPPLGLPPPDVSADEAMQHPAVQLFLTRGRAADADFAVDAGTVTAAVDIVRRLDGLPLAIELAAARLRVLPVDEIAERLSDRFRLLVGGVRTAVARHRTLRAVVEWSWELLSEPERLLAERLAIFPGGVSVAAAAAICGDDRLAYDDVPELLLSLVDKSLLHKGLDAGGTPGSGRRYRMLETIREYGVGRLDERGELDAVRARHADYFAGRAREQSPHLRTAAQLDALAEFSSERDNLTAALRYLCDSEEFAAAASLVLDLCWYWTITGAHSEMGDWTEVVLRLIDRTDASGGEHLAGGELPDRARIEAMRMVGRVSGPVTETTESWEDIQQRLVRLADQLARLDDGSDALTSMLRLFVEFFAARGSNVDAIVARGSASADPWVRAMTAALRVMDLENSGDIDQLRGEVENACAAFDAIGDRWGLSTVLSVRGGVRRMDGNLDGAVADYERALAMLRELGATEDDMFLQLKMTGLREQQGDFASAHRSLAAVRGHRGGSPPSMESVLLADAAEIGLLLAEGDTDGAADLAARLRPRLPLAPNGHNPVHGHLDAMVAAACARVAVAVGEVATAGADLAIAYPAAVTTEDGPMTAQVGVSIAIYAVVRGRAADGAEILGAASVLRGADDPDDTAVARAREQLTAALGAEAFERHFAVGRELSREEAVARLDPAPLGHVPVD